MMHPLPSCTRLSLCPISRPAPARSLLHTKRFHFRLPFCCSEFSGASSPTMSNQIRASTKLMEFPHLIKPHRDVMVDLVSSLQKRFDSHLLPPSLPPDVEYYQNLAGTSQGTLLLRSGTDSSPIDVVLASWLHLKQSNGGDVNITNIACYVKTRIDVPHFQFELVQTSPTFLILFLDLIPRKDTVLNPDYLRTFYEQTDLEKLRLRVANLPEVKPYFSSSLYFRNVVSPTAILVGINCEAGGAPRVEEIVRDVIGPVSSEAMEIWMGLCDGVGREVEDGEREKVEKRDGMIKRKAIEMDLSSTMPAQFGEEVADRVLRVITTAFRC